ncbi:MAG: sensor domain-containing diguanylate cyclase [Firmicutes bacterium]|nr:sensor domain-containing diguanylate cyclase [Bacillota bacterium]
MKSKECYSDLSIVRILCILGGIITPIVTYTWKVIYPKLTYSVFNGWIFTCMFLLVLGLTYLNETVKKNATIFSYIIYYLSTLSGLYFAFVNNFCFGYTFLLFLVIFSVSLIFKTPKSLLYYEISIIIIILLGLYIKKDKLIINPIILTITLIIFCIISFLIIKHKYEMHKELSKSNNLFKNIFQESPIGIMLYNKNGKLIKANNSIYNIVDKIYDTKFDCLSKLINESLYLNLKQGKSIQMEKTIKINKDNLVKHFDIHITPLSNMDGYLMQIKDITDIKNYQNKIKKMAYYDTLTDLPNRKLFEDRMKMTLKQAKRYDNKFAFLFFDLDNFKIINDTYGHSIGDALLKKVADRLKNTLRESDTLARLAGDEFVLLLPFINEKEDLLNILKRIENVMDKPFYVDDIKLNVLVSIGISLYPLDGKTSKEIIHSADKAMYKAKKYKGTNYKFYSDNKS